MKKEILCPYCKANLKQVGFRTTETVYKTFEWDWDKKKGYFENDDGDTDNTEVDNAFCNQCGEEILDFVRDNHLME